MSRTKGSGWGAGSLFYQLCPLCGKKKVLHKPFDNRDNYKCTSCKNWIESDTLIPTIYKSVAERILNNP